MSNTDDERIESASPPCLLGEFDQDDIDPAYFGYLSVAEQVAVLNLLLECERAGARGVSDISEHRDSKIKVALREIAHDEARFCAMLVYHIKQLGGTPSEATGSFYHKLIALDAFDRQLDLLDRGQSWVADRLRELLPKLPAGTLRTDLADMLATHDRNIERARTLILSSEQNR